MTFRDHVSLPVKNEILAHGIDDYPVIFDSCANKGSNHFKVDGCHLLLQFIDELCPVNFHVTGVLILC